MKKCLGPFVSFVGGAGRISLKVGGSVAWSWEESQGARQPTSEVSSQR